MPNGDTVVEIDGRHYGHSEVAKLKQVQRSLSRTLREVESLLARVLTAREAS